MGDTRRANVEWRVTHGDRGHTLLQREWGAIQVAVLMDIRDELQKLNALLECTNFTNIPRTLTAIKRKIPARRRRKVQATST